MNNKLTLLQSTVLRLIAQSPGGVWVPSAYPQYLEGIPVYVHGASFANAIKALWNKGLAKQVSELSYYASEITEDGRKLAEIENGKPVIQ